MFSHLHSHTHFSFGLGVSSPEVLAEAAAERGVTALACTDTNGVYGAVEFQGACDAAGVRPILGAHLVANGQEVVALAANERGWGALAGRLRKMHMAGRTEADGRGRTCPPCSQPTETVSSSSLATSTFWRRYFGSADPRTSMPSSVLAVGRHEVLAAARRLRLPWWRRMASLPHGLKTGAVIGCSVPSR